MKVLVIGAGAAGLMAAAASAASGGETVLLEKNEKAGKKIYITGKGRCNVTNACDFEVFLKNICSGSRFMMSSLRLFGPEDMMEFLEKNGCRVKVERGNRVFPVSDHASDVTKALLKATADRGVKLQLNTEVTEIEKTDSGFRVSVLRHGEKGCLTADRVIICTGGLSYPSTGSTGDGYRFAEEAGHSVGRLLPSLTAFCTEEDTSDLSGIGLKNVGLKLIRDRDGKVLFEEEGELLFTHRGISGPLVLTGSAVVCGELAAGEKIRALVDLKPALDEKTLDSRLLRDFEASKNADLGNALSGLLISGIRQKVLEVSGIDPRQKVHELTREQRTTLRKTVKGIPYTVTETGGFSEAVITRGGVKLAEIDPKTMESKKVPGLYFAGEVLDIDAFTGGFNLQLAWSTGFAAGTAAGRQESTEKQRGRICTTV